MAINFGTQFAVTDFVGYTFGSMIVAARCLIPGLGFVVQLTDEVIADIECLRVVAMATNFGTTIAITGCVWTIATRQLVMERV